MKKLSVLHLEDSKHYAREIRDLLRRQGCETVSASTVADAWTKYRQRRFDLLIVDLRLREFEAGQPPDRGGLEFLCGVRRAHDSTPAVLLTGVATTADVTGAGARHPGVLELAGDGTVFLDEIGEIPLTEQPKLLRAIETRSYRPLGARERRRLGARIIVATNRDLDAMVHAGTFRADLYHRINGLRLHLPSLRQRRHDIADIIQEIAAEAGPTRPLTREALEVLAATPWPGNVRELRATIETLFSMSKGKTIGVDDVNRVLDNRRPSSRAAHGIRELAAEIVELGGLEALRMIEATIIRQKLEESDGNRTRTGAALGLSRKQVARRASNISINPATGVAERRGSGVFRREPSLATASTPARRSK